ncbi:hypothetical protein CI610_02209 [invertebrate metagenome]|uniref:Transposase n=1 Tax=invertebrate metagenome TaxID=1711999 RepID=A0A2H9T6I5_9ZZZZ
MNTNVPYTKEFREELLKLAESIGIPEAAKQLGLSTAKLYSWKSVIRKKKSVSH